MSSLALAMEFRTGSDINSDSTLSACDQAEASQAAPRMFDLLGKDAATRARRGRLTTAHGVIETPAFMPVGTQGSVKAVSPRELREMNAQVVLGNTYHLFVRPGLEVIGKFGGLHRFM